MIFECTKCGLCCTNLIRPLEGTDYAFGVWLIGDEPKLFPESMVSPYWGIYDPKTQELTVYIYQLNVNTCPHLKDNSCTIYEKRPQICRAYPLSAHTKQCGKKLRVDEGALDDGCPATKAIPGTNATLMEAFGVKISLAAINMDMAVREFFTQPLAEGSYFMVHDLKTKKWLKLTKSLALAVLQH